MLKFILIYNTGVTPQLPDQQMEPKSRTGLFALVTFETRMSYKTFIHSWISEATKRTLVVSRSSVTEHCGLIGRSSRLLTCKLKQTLQISVIKRVPFQQMVTLTTKLLKELHLHIPDKIKVKLLLMQHRLSLLEKEKSSLLTPWTFSLKQSCCGLSCIKYKTGKKTTLVRT